MRLDKSKLFENLSDDYVSRIAADFRTVEMHIKKVTGLFKVHIEAKGKLLQVIYTDFNKFNMGELSSKDLVDRTNGGDGSRVNSKALAVKWHRIDSTYSELIYKRNGKYNYALDIKIIVSSEMRAEDLMDMFENQIYSVIDFRDEYVHEFMFNMILHGLNLYKYEDVILNE